MSYNKNMSLIFKNNINKIFFSIIFIFVFFSAQIAYAADLGLSPSSGSYEMGKNIRVNITLSSSDIQSNAVSGILKFPTDTLSLTSISKSNSIISIWSTEPSYSNSTGTVNFEGVMLSGYSGSGGTVLTLNFQAKAIGTANLSFSKFLVLANDGNGTIISKNPGQASLKVIKAVENKVEEKKVVPVQKPDPVVSEVRVVEKNSNIIPGIQIRKISDDSSLDQFSVFKISSVGKKENTTYRVEIDDVVYDWKNQTEGVLTTPTLTRGPHKLVITIDTIDGGVLSSTNPFSIKNVPAPVITEYSPEISESSYIAIKGRADPDTDVFVVTDYITKDSAEIKKREDVVRSDSEGKFNYISEKVLAGVYNISAYTKIKDDFNSEYSPIIKINVMSEQDILMNDIKNNLFGLIVIALLLVLVPLFMVWLWHKLPLLFKKETESDEQNIKK